MNSPLKTQAIQTALTGDWNNAINLNEQVLQEDPADVDTLNRLAFAYTVVGRVRDAKNTYQKVLDIDTQNPIAQRNLKKLNSDKVSSFSGNQNLFAQRPLDSLFLEESGKTKVIDLINIADPKIIAHLIIGEQLQLRIKRLKIFVLDQRNQYVGVLPDNIGKRLIRFLKGGNNYDAYIKSTDKHKVSIFIREVKRAARFKNQPSFVVGEKSHLLISRNTTNALKSKQSELEDDEDDQDSEEESF